MVVMEKRKKPYLLPAISIRRSFQTASFCAGSGTPKFLNADGSEGDMNAVEWNIDAVDAASRRFPDNDFDEGC